MSILPTDQSSAGRAHDDAPKFRYDAQMADRIEQKWQNYWDAHETFVTLNPGQPGFDATKPKFYCLDMFPYPSGAGLHVGHPEGYTATDIISRFMRMKGHNVLHPMGWDAFGLPAEQYAIQTGIHPSVTTREAINNFRRQLKRFGFSYDWSREFGTIDPEYYKWTQWIFLRMYNAWYDREAANAMGTRGRARPIEDLIAQLESGDLRIGFDGELVHVGISASNPIVGGEPVGTRRWHELTGEEQRELIDSQRLVYLGETTVNWCPALGTVLANDEVIDGRSERGGHPVLRKPLNQWMFRITTYAERLLDDLKLIEWSESTKTMQAEWIGRSEGAEVEFEIQGTTESLTVFTTRPDTIFGATYMVVAPEHELVQDMLASANNSIDVAALRAYVAASKNKSDVDRMTDAKVKTGVFTGVYCLNPATGAKIPVWTADYVLMGYGTGAIMAVPAHDERDWEFAKAFNLPIVPTYRRADQAEQPAAEMEECLSGEGVAINSANAEVSLNGLGVAEAKAKIIDWLERTGRGVRTINYRLRDWAFSRQRYWGEPFPIVYDRAGRHYPVGNRALPVELPPLADYSPVESDDPQPLLAKATAWINTTAGAAGVDPDVLPPETPVRREANTMPGSAGSSWYFLRYCDAQNSERFTDRKAEEYWMNGGVDLYIGGSEHAVGHLLYSRFWQKVLFDLGEVSTPEPIRKLFHQGMITSFAYQRADKSLVPCDEVDEPSEGVFVERRTNAALTPIVAKMSKSLKNVVNPDDIIAQFGADAFRLYEMYMGPLAASKPWNTKDAVGIFRLLQRIWRVAIDEQTGNLRLLDAPKPEVEKMLHRMIAKVDNDVPRLALNTAIASMFEFTNVATSAGGLTRDQLERFTLVLAPFAPHIAEELWSKLGHGASLAYAPFPVADPKMLVDETVEIAVQIAGKIRARIQVPTGADKETIEKAAMADATVVAALMGKTVQKVVVVPGKLVNILAS